MNQSEVPLLFRLSGRPCSSVTFVAEVAEGSEMHRFLERVTRAADSLKGTRISAEYLDRVATEFEDKCEMVSCHGASILDALLLPLYSVKVI